MSGERRTTPPTIGHVPELYSTVPAAGRQELPVGAEDAVQAPVSVRTTPPLATFQNFSILSPSPSQPPVARSFPLGLKTTDIAPLSVWPVSVRTTRPLATLGL